ncbi:sulfatase-like hydrolase/transferase [Luteolibacter marinus]|uniref:sulfatase-like hydrolase/transferase n=1 Tax=Luteolibacter marinus TaxID=2776705 RepID=UPI001867D445|nr:sulfatase-like hydrolase/transferase [Luteolibacter marinus]
MKALARHSGIALLLVVASPARAAEDGGHPNILMICVDDLRTQLGCYGDAVVKSPNIDRLADTGLVFDRCYVQVAVCNPSRASMMTGLRPDTLKCWTLQYHFRETHPDAVTLPQYLRRQGYHVEGYGKIFHNPWQDPRSWDLPHRFGAGDWNHYDERQKALIGTVRDALPDDAWQKASLRGPVTNDPDIRDDDHPDGAMTSMVVDRLDQLKDSGKPFFLAAGFVLPHLPWCPPRKYWDLYDRGSLPLAANPEVPDGAPAVELGTNYELHHYADCIDFPAPLQGKISDAKARRLIHGYLASVSFVDAQIGRLLEALKASGLAENTVVVLWSDHGYKLGEHNGWGKMTNFEIDTRVPFIIRDPRAKRAGQRCGQIVETLDLFPTLCELAGVAAPSFTEGKSAAKLLKDPAAEHRDAAYSQYFYRPLIGNSVRTRGWRYTEWRNMEDGRVKHRVLYDHRENDQENANVAAAHPAVVAELEETLSKVLPPRRVAMRPVVHSLDGGGVAAVRFVNRHPGEVRLTWISPQGERARQWDIAAGKAQRIDSHAGHVFVAESLDGRYYETITVAAAEGGGRRVIELGGAP